MCACVCVCISRECKCTPTHIWIEIHTQKIQWIISRAFAHKFAGVKGGRWKWGARGFELLELTNVSSRSKTLRPGDCSVWGQHYRASTRHRNSESKCERDRTKEKKGLLTDLVRFFCYRIKVIFDLIILAFMFTFVEWWEDSERLELWLMVISLHFILLCLNLLYFFIFGHIS